jgi:hypothetical protein
MEYIDKGICIWCQKSKPEVSFTDRPHSIPKSMSSDMIGFDICNHCNHYFGERDKLSEPNLTIEVCVKEIFGMTKFMFKQDKNEKSYKELPSIYFNYKHSKRQIEIKASFKFQRNFLTIFTRQFNRGLYELFLQEYHRQTKNGLDIKFEKVREFARWNRGYLPVYCLSNPKIFLAENKIDKPLIHFTTKSINDIDIYGFYSFYLWGHFFFLEVTPLAEIFRIDYLQESANGLIIPVEGDEGIIELKNILKLDFMLRGLYS